MAHSIIEEIGHILPPSRNLAETLARAADYATQQAHPEVTLEHLLLALTEDPDAARVLAVSAVDIDQLKGDVSSHLGRLEDRSATGGAAGISTDLRQILEASAAAARGRRDAIDGAIVLAAIVGDGRSAAAHMLRAHGLTFEEAIKALQSALEEAPEEPESPEPEEHAAPLAPVEVVGETAAASQQPAPPPSYHPPGASADEILASARQRVEGRMGHVPDDEAAEPSPPAPDAETAHVSAEASAETAPEQNAPVVSQEANGDDAAGAVPPQEAEPPISGPGPRPAPPSKRPRPPGAIREPAPRGPAPRGDDAGDPQIEAAAASAARDAHANAAHPASAEDQGRAQFAKETAIDEVLASIRKSGRPAPANADAVPASGPAAPPPPSTPQWTSAPPREPGRPPTGAQPPARPVPAPGSAPKRPSDRDFFAPGGQSLGNAAAPPLPPQPAAAAGPPRAPLPGLPPLKNSPPGAAPPPPPLAHRPQQHARADHPGMPPMSGPRPSAPPPAPAAARGAPAQRPRATDVSVGQMVENIPRTMRVGIPVVVEARIARAEVKALADGLQGGGAVWRHELTVTKAMSVRLRAPDGGFFIETASPETQWIENTLGLITDDYASWRWTVTPRERGAKRLQLVISARTVGTDGLAAETALPDQLVSVKVRVNYAQTAKRVGGWALAAIAGGLLARFGEDLPATVASLMSTIVK